ncbi:MAG TPA: protease inhibitor I42 family protein [Terrimicrobiaceae bacterium]
MASIQINENHSGNVLRLPVGGEVMIELKENAATGYAWDIENLDERMLDSVRAPGGSPARSLPGAAGKFRLRLIAKAPGETSVRLKHWRDWEGEGSVTSRFEVTLQIAE